ncbi:MAG: electron transfer flavoprotein subunit alpha/FixB family protein [Thermoanaerobaculia bacterium]|nr:electron transfer flavoprotein subunit alpha/FixB family protein [Thermoanaerobaculia bacterium]
MSAKIWVVAQHREGKLHRGSLEAVAAGQRLARETGGSVEAVVLGAGVDALAGELAANALAGVRTIDAAPLADYTPGAYVAALAAAMAAEAPDFVLFPHTYQSCEYVPRLAQASGAAHLPEVIGFTTTADGLLWKRPILAGKLHAQVRVKGSGPVVATLQSGAFPADGREAGSAPTSPLAVEASIARDREILGVEQAATETVDLSKAEAIVAVGRGIGGADKMAPVEELAAALRAELGASRPVIDSGWLPRDRQIGSSGQTVAPKLYLALGISGAIQHLVGMKGASCVVAINKDASAPIFKIARYGIVGDLHEIVPALTKVLRESAS